MTPSLRTVAEKAPLWDPDDRSLWTVDECAAFLALSTWAIYRRVEAGEIPCVRFGRRLRFVPARVRQWVNDHEVAG